MSKAISPILVVLVVVSVGCQGVVQTETPTVASSELSPPGEDVDSYLASQLLHASFGGVVFCAHQTLAVESKEGATTSYLWALCREFYCDQQRLAGGSGVSLPVALEAKRQDGGRWSFAHAIPRDGLDYGADVSALFPRYIQRLITPQTVEATAEFNRRVAALQDTVTNAAQDHFSSCQ